MGSLDIGMRSRIHMKSCASRSTGRENVQESMPCVFGHGCRRLLIMPSISGSSDARKFRRRYKPQIVLGPTDGFYGTHGTCTLWTACGSKRLLSLPGPFISRLLLIG